MSCAQVVSTVLIKLYRESRRANAKLQIDKPREPLATMFMTNGNVSARFPKDLTSLFDLDGEFPALQRFETFTGNTQSSQPKTQKLLWPTMRSLNLQNLETTTSIGLCNSAAFDINWWNEYLYCSSWVWELTILSMIRSDAEVLRESTEL